LLLWLLTGSLKVGRLHKGEKTMWLHKKSRFEHTHYSLFYRISRWRSQTGSSNNLARFSDNNVIQNQINGSLSRLRHFFCTAVMGNIFSAIKGNIASKPKYTYHFAIITERNGVPKAKWGYKARRMYTTSTDSV